MFCHHVEGVSCDPSLNGAVRVSLAALGYVLRMLDSVGYI